MGLAAPADLADVLRGSDLNLVEFMKAMALAEDARVLEQEGLVLVAALHPNPGPYRNAAVLTADGLSAAAVLKLTSGFFTEQQRGFVLWVRDHGSEDRELERIADQRGWQLLEPEGLPQLGRLGTPDPIEPRTGVTVAAVSDAETRRDFLRVNAEAWGMPDVPIEVAKRILFEPDLLDDPSGTRFGVIAYLEGKPASTCLALVHPGGVVGGYWGATAPWALGHGLHDLTTRTVYNNAFAVSPEARFAVCQNSPGAAKNLTRMGFQQVSSYKRYLVPGQER